MKELPHLYQVTVRGGPADGLTTAAEGLPALAVAPPRAFDGPGDAWSPEELLLAAVANCLVLSFRAVARASRLTWHSIECESEGTLDKVDRKTAFTRIVTRARLVIAADQSPERAEKLLNKAESTCFITNSLAVATTLECEIESR